MAKKKKAKAVERVYVGIPAPPGESEVLDSIVEVLKEAADALLAWSREDRPLPDIAVVGTLTAIKKLTGQWYLPPATDGSRRRSSRVLPTEFQHSSGNIDIDSKQNVRKQRRRGKHA